MQRVVSIWLPRFPIERLRRALRSPSRSGRDYRAASAPEAHGAGTPFALVTRSARGLELAAVDDAAAAAGLTPGQALADARTRVPELLTRPAEPSRDAAALATLVQWSGRYGPLRNSEGEDGLWVDISGVAHLFGGETALLADCRRQLAAAGFTARLALADSVAAAHALARFGPAAQPIAIAAPGASAAALAPLPVAALRLAPTTVLLLRRLGLARIGDLYGLPRASLARRFREARKASHGESSAALADDVVLRLDQALGAIREPRRPFVPAPCRLARLVFAEPLTSAAGVEVALSAAVAELCKRLGEAGEGARRLSLTLYRTDGSSTVLAIGTSAASRDEGHLRRLFGEKLDTLDLGFGVDVVILEAPAVEPLAAIQAGLAAARRPASQASFAELVDRLANRVGADAVHRLARRATHLPEQADMVVPALAAVAADPALSTRPGAPRPPLLLTRPEPIEVIAAVPEGPPRRFLWRRARHRIVKAEGPERIAPAWWQAIGAAVPSAARRPRDYYRIEDDRGGRYWVFREGLYEEGADDVPPAWYVHGLFG